MLPTIRFAVLAVAGLALALTGSTDQRQGQGQAVRASALDPAIVKAVNETGPDLEKLAESHRSLMKAVGELEGLYAQLSRKAEEVSRLAAGAQKTEGEAAGRLFKAAREMQEMQQSFNLQFLALQEAMQKENRQFTMVSNVMKTKHDTAKNAINNVR